MVEIIDDYAVPTRQYTEISTITSPE
jgi:hypothetical protein